MGFDVLCFPGLPEVDTHQFAPSPRPAPTAAHPKPNAPRPPACAESPVSGGGGGRARKEALARNLAGMSSSSHKLEDSEGLGRHCHGKKNSCRFLFIRDYLF